MTLRHSVLRSAAAAVLILAAPFARAQTPIDRDADAERLFNEAKTLMEARKFAEACPKLESAYRKDQQQGTLLNLAYCHKEMGASWLAWVEFREADSKSTDKQRKEFAHEKMKELEKGLSRVMIDPQSRYDVTEVMLEDKRIYDAEKGTTFYAEPGQRKVIFHAKGKKPAILLISVGAPKDRVLHIQVPEMAEEERVPVGPVESPAPAPAPAPSPPPAAEASSWSGQKTLAVIVGVAGATGLVVGGIFGMKTILGACNDGKALEGGQPCSAEARNDASNEAAVSTIGFVAGGVLLGGAVALWLTAPNKKTSGGLLPRSITAHVGPTWAGLRGTF